MSLATHIELVDTKEEQFCDALRDAVGAEIYFRKRQRYEEELADSGRGR